MEVITEGMWEKYGKRWTVDDPLREGPFLFPHATAFLEMLLEPNFEVLEYGAGGSTVWLAERVHHVTSFETDIRWEQKVYQHILERELSRKVTMVYAPQLLEGEMPPYDISYKRYDLIYSDGDERGRTEFIEKTIGLTRVLGYYVIENANRPIYADVVARVDCLGWPRYVIPSIPPAEYFQTNFYRRPPSEEPVSL